MRRTRAIIEPTIVLAIAILGFHLHRIGVLDVHQFERALETMASSRWAPVVVVSLLVFMYVLALPASLVVLASGVFFTPAVATAMAVVGGVVGSVGAYHIAGRLSPRWSQRFARSQLHAILRENSGFLSLLTVRVLPGVPHALINYTAGLVRTPLVAFVLATAVGLGVKAFIYTSAIHHATHVEPGEAVVGIGNLWPLLALAALAIGGLGLKRRATRRKASGDDCLDG